jgi:hypothetical protein
VRTRLPLITLVLSTLAPAAPASAQFSDTLADVAKRAGAGATIGAVVPIDSDVEVGPVLGFQFGLAPKEGWALSAGFGWFGGDLLLGDRDVGNVRVKPLMAGVAYTWIHGRMATSVALNAGVSFNSADIDNQYRQSFGPGTDLDLDMKNSFCVRPSVEVEYALTPKFAFTGWAGFFATRIDSTLDTPVGRFEDEWNPSAFTFSVGAIVYPFR